MLDINLSHKAVLTYPNLLKNIYGILQNLISAAHYYHLFDKNAK